MHAEVTRHLLERVKLVGNIVCINLPSEHIVFVTHPFYATCLYLPLNHFEVLLITFSMNTVFEQVAKNAVRGLWARRSKINLVGAHIDVFTGEWTQKVILSYTNNLVIVLPISVIFIENLGMLDL